MQEEEERILSVLLQPFGGQFSDPGTCDVGMDGIALIFGRKNRILEFGIVQIDIMIEIESSIKPEGRIQIWRRTEGGGPVTVFLQYLGQCSDILMQAEPSPSTPWTMISIEVNRDICDGSVQEVVLIVLLKSTPSRARLSITGLVSLSHP
jgi:hypothetical protein